MIHRAAFRSLHRASRRMSPAMLTVPRSRSYVYIAPMFPAPPPPPPPRKSHKLRNVLLSLTAGAAAILYTWVYMEATAGGEYPPTVLAHLRDGLTAEANNDYDTALHSYILALQAADSDAAELHYLSDEYTGIQLKVADMYEKLDMHDAALQMYREMSTAFIQALAGSDSAGVISAELRPHLIQRGLRVAIKTAFFQSATNPEAAKMSLLVHFLMAQDEVCKRSPEMAKLIKHGSGSGTASGPNRLFKIPVGSRVPPPAKDDSLSPSSGTSTAAATTTAARAPFEFAWMPFRDELFYARDLFVGLCIATGDIPLALHTQMASTEWMTATGHDTGSALMSFYNVGAIFYLQSEGGGRLLPTPGSATTEALKSAVAATTANEASALANSKLCFDMLVRVIDALPGHARRDGCVDDVRALAAYGSGVVAVRSGQLTNARELLREARLRAKGCGYGDLVDNCEVELRKLDKLILSRQRQEANQAEQNENADSEAAATTAATTLATSDDSDSKTAELQKTAGGEKEEGKDSATTIAPPVSSLK